MWYCFFFFFFKQKTADEVRISDWSSDVCSSDLLQGRPHRAGVLQLHPRRPQGPGRYRAEDRQLRLPDAPSGRRRPGRHHHRGRLRNRARPQGGRGGRRRRRSEEHTSELPSLMRISYAVFCLKKKKTKKKHTQK